ncbi:MAG TPA: GntR family transcriptional regulator [Acidobacteriaceae bacterium]|nr:GntR family transcriptional regulator [Acidobacteriaceae bacterium]
MRLWFSSSSEVPVYRQLVTQVTLAILSGELRPGDRLPSTRELARRFGLHPNTISAGYRELERTGWTEQRHGSGVYVRARKQATATPEQVLEERFGGFLRDMRDLKIAEETIRKRLAEWAAAPLPERLVLVDPDEEAREILLAELKALASVPIAACTVEACGHLDGSPAVYLCRPSQESKVRAALRAGAELVVLPIRSANNWLAPWLPAPQGHLVGVVSRWPEFLSAARTMLIAAGLPAEALLFRDAREADWRRGLSQASIILCDAATAKLPGLAGKKQVVVFPIVADSLKSEIARCFAL